MCVYYSIHTSFRLLDAYIARSFADSCPCTHARTHAHGRACVWRRGGTVFLGGPAGHAQMTRTMIVRRGGKGRGGGRGRYLRKQRHSPARRKPPHGLSGPRIHSRRRRRGGGFLLHVNVWMIMGRRGGGGGGGPQANPPPAGQNFKKKKT